MECFNHSGTAAAGTCQICGKGLCADCLNRFSPPACEPCLHAHNSSVARRLIFDIGITAVILFGVMIAAFAHVGNNVQVSFMLGLILACAYWGWQFLGRFSVPIILTSGLGLMLYLLIKILLAMCFGLILGPWQIFKRVKELAAINTLKKQIAAGKA